MIVWLKCPYISWLKRLHTCMLLAHSTKHTLYLCKCHWLVHCTSSKHYLSPPSIVWVQQYLSDRSCCPQACWSELHHTLPWGICGKKHGDWCWQGVHIHELRSFEAKANALKKLYKVHGWGYDNLVQWSCKLIIISCLHLEVLIDSLLKPWMDGRWVVGK